jgi:hypothetical protein
VNIYVLIPAGEDYEGGLLLRPILLKQFGHLATLDIRIVDRYEFQDKGNHRRDGKEGHAVIAHEPVNPVIGKEHKYLLWCRLDLPYIAARDARGRTEAFQRPLDP